MCGAAERQADSLVEQACTIRHPSLTTVQKMYKLYIDSDNTLQRGFAGNLQQDSTFTLGKVLPGPFFPRSLTRRANGFDNSAMKNK
jgi:hypothetical protein